MENRKRAKHLETERTHDGKQPLMFVGFSDSHQQHLMSPPDRIYIQGTEEYNEALESGFLQVSLPDDDDSSRLPLHPPPENVPSNDDDYLVSNPIVSPPFQMKGDPFDFDVEYETQDVKQQEEEHEEEEEQDENAYPQNSSSSPVARRKRKQSTTLTDDIVMEKTCFSDIIGHGAVKLRIEEILLPIGLPPALADSILTGVRAMPTSILLYGPPGCGKTQLARAIAGQAYGAFLPVSPSDILSKFVGESEASVRGIFKKAYEHAMQVESRCAIVFFDEIDALGQSRESKGTGEGEGCSRRVLAELLTQLNYIAINKNRFTGNEWDDDENSSVFSKCSAQETTDRPARVIVVAATNRREDCDPALLRRFGIQLEVPLPTKRDRKKMLVHHLSKVDSNLSKENLEHIAAVTNGFSGSDMENFVRDAAMAPVRECLRQAALLRKRATKEQQSGGDASGQEDAAPPIDPDLAAQTALLNGFQTLRPVSYDDLWLALKNWHGNHSQGEARLLPPDKHQVTHYDSSSDEED